MPAATYAAQVGSQTVELPIIELGSGDSIALMMTIDRGVNFMQRAGAELAEALAPLRPDIIVTAATLGIPVAIEVTRALGLDDYLVLQKSKKWHLQGSPSVQLNSVTTESAQSLTLDHRRIGDIAGRRVVFVDDVISSGGSTKAATELLIAHGAELVGIGTLLTEGTGWRETLGERAELVVALGEIPFPVA